MGNDLGQNTASDVASGTGSDHVISDREVETDERKQPLT